MSVVHYRKGPTKRTINFTNKTYFRTDAACGVYSEVPNPDQGMKHTDNIDDVTCQKCLDSLVIYNLSSAGEDKGSSEEMEPVEFSGGFDDGEWN